MERGQSLAKYMHIHKIINKVSDIYCWSTCTFKIKMSSWLIINGILPAKLNISFSIKFKVPWSFTSTMTLAICKGGNKRKEWKEFPVVCWHPIIYSTKDIWSMLSLLGLKFSIWQCRTHWQRADCSILQNCPPPQYLKDGKFNFTNQSILRFKSWHPIFYPTKGRGS